MKYIGLILFFVQVASADVGQVIKHLGSKNGHLLRDGKKINLAVGLPLEQNDRILTEDSYTVLYLEPSTQISLSKGSEITLTQNFLDDEKEARSFSLIELVKGFIRVQVTRDVGVEIDQQVKANDVTFGVRGTEFEVAIEGEDVDLDVIEGQVEASSPLIQSFAPEIIKTNEGLRFSKKDKKYNRRKLALRFKNHTGFLKKKEIQKKWKTRQLKKKKKNRKAVKKGNR